MADEPFPVRWTGKQAVVVLPEQIDVSNAGQIRELLLVVINRGARALIVDMSTTVSCDYAAADALARAHQRAVASGTELRLVVFSAVVRRALGLSGIDRLVPVYPFLEVAVATLPAVPARSAVPRAADGEGWRGGAGTRVPHVRADLGGQAQRVPRPGAGDRADSSPDRSPAAVTPDVVMAMIEAISDGVALADIDGTLLLASRRLEEMFGYQHGELRGQPVEQLIPAYLQDVHRRHRASYDQDPAARPMDAGARLVGLRKDQSTFPTEVSLSPVHTAAGRFTLAVVRDVTASRRREDFAGLAAAAVATRGIDFLDHITGSLHQVSLNLHSAAQLDEVASSQQIAQALSRLDDTIGEIRYAAFTGQDENSEKAGNNGKITKITVRPGAGPDGTDSQADNPVEQAACSEPAGAGSPQ